MLFVLSVFNKPPFLSSFQYVIGIGPIQSDASPHQGLRGPGEGEAGEGGGESALPGREAAPPASVGNVTERVTSKAERNGVFLDSEEIKREILTPSSLPTQTLCKQLHAKIDVVDEERYDCESKVHKHNKDVSC